LQDCGIGLANDAIQSTNAPIAPSNYQITQLPNYPIPMRQFWLGRISLVGSAKAMYSPE